RGLAQLLRLRGVPARHRSAARRAAEARPALPARAAACLQPQVLPGVAAALLLLRALERPADRRRRLPARRVAADAAGTLGEDARPDCAVKFLAAVVWALAKGGGERAKPVRLLCGVASAALLLTFTGSAAADWPEFGYDPGRHNVGPASSG